MAACCDRDGRTPPMTFSDRTGDCGTRAIRIRRDQFAQA